MNKGDELLAKDYNSFIIWLYRISIPVLAVIQCYLFIEKNVAHNVLILWTSLFIFLWDFYRMIELSEKLNDESTFWTIYDFVVILISLIFVILTSICMIPLL